MPDFVWYELMTADVEAAKTFYRHVIGWNVQDMPDMAYTLFLAGDTHVGGVMALPEEVRSAGVPPHWIGYVAVEDVDASADRARTFGGSVHVPPRDIPNVGRFAMIADPQGAAITVFKSSNPADSSPANRTALGHGGWHELFAADWEKAFSFYSDMFGWQKADTVDMGEMGKYQLFAVGEQPIGGMFNKPPFIPRPFWLYYFNVDAINAAADRVKAAGGKIVNGPMEVPGGQWIVQCTDAQGAMFALVAPKA